MKNGLILLLLLAACSPKNQGPNKFANDEKLINIYELQDQRNVQALLPLLKAKKEEHRIAAAMAFASIQDTIAIPYLNQMLQIDQDPMPRRAAAYALGQIGSTNALGILIAAFDQELFPANRPYVMEAIGKCGDSNTIALFEGVEYQDSALQMGWAYGVFRLGLKGYRSASLNNRMMELLNDDNKDLAILASHYVYRGLRDSKNSELVDSLISVSRYEEVKERFGLLKPSIELQKTTSYFLDCHGEFKQWDSYKQVDFLSRLKPTQKMSYTFCSGYVFDRYPNGLVIDEDFEPVAQIVVNAAFEKMLEIYNNDPEENYNPSIDKLLFYALAQSEDMALQSIAAIELQKQHYFDELHASYFPNKNYKSPNWISLLQKVKSELKLPQQAETYIDVCKAIEALGGRKFEGYQPEYNHPIDWEFVKTIPADQQVLIKTNKGEITLQLFVEEAPGTTANFLKLVDSSFYDNKFFHRVVPQFVVQGGCPRGDGWGSLDWTQRSEFSNYQRYETGTVGVASAGKDTEGVQFFITHCPTPHLDGRYSIFARVVSGMDVVNKMEVGDRMISIKRVKEEEHADDA